MSEKREKLTLRILWVLTALVCLKSIFTDFGPDSAYQVAMSYRHLRGDAMLLKMWEPHQTSIFLNDLLMGLYHLIVPSYAGVVLFLQVCGTLLFGLLGWFVYRTLTSEVAVDEGSGSSRIDSFTGQVLWMFLLVFRAKQTPFPEFANLEIGFSVLAFCFFIRFFRQQEKIGYLLLSGVSIALQVLCYPTCVLSAAAAVVLLFLFTKRKWKNCLIFLGTEAVLGAMYLGYFLIRLGGSTLFTVIRNIFLSDTHSTFRFGGYWTGFGIMAGSVVGCILAAAVVRAVAKAILIARAGSGGAEANACRVPSLGTLSAVIFLVLEVLMVAFQRRMGVDWNCSIYVLPVVLIVLALLGYRRANVGERQIWITGMALSAASFLATMFLTDLGMITIVAYLVLGGMVSLVLFRHLFKDDKRVIIVILFVVLVHRGLVVWGIGNTNGRVQTIWEVQNVIRGGPAVGVVCDHVTKQQALWTMEDFHKFLEPEDKIFLVGEDLMDSLTYLYAGTEISNYSTIDTPQYNTCLEEYLRLNPDKEPTVVAVSSWFGASNVPEDSWIMQWVNARYELVADGCYWRFYRKVDH